MTQQDALIHLMREHQADLWRYLRMLGCEPAQADDLTQETFLYIYRNPITEFSRAATAAYLRKAARHMFLNRRRAERREQPLNEDAAEAAWLEVSPEGRADERLDALRECLQKLAERSRRAVELKYTEGRGEAEVAERLETTLKAAKALLQRARQQLRECVAGRIERVKP